MSSESPLAPWASDDSFSKNAFVQIRLVLALTVIFSHSFPLVSGSNAQEPLFRWTHTLTLGDLAVDLFLAISGFLVARSWQGSATTKDFLFKRILRIYPAFLSLTILQAFVLAPLAAGLPVSGISPRQLALIAFEGVDLTGYGFPYGGLYDVFAANPFPHEMNGSLWTIRYEFICYLLLALTAAILFYRTRFFLGAYVAVLLAGLFDWTPPSHKIFTFLIGAVGPWPRLLSFFLAGALFYRLRHKILYQTWLAGMALVFLIGAAEIYPPILRVMLPTAGVYLLLWLAYQPRLLTWIGKIKDDFSYGTYLYGFPIQQSMVLWLPVFFTSTPIRLACGASLLSIIAGALSWYLVEKRFMAFKPQVRPQSVLGMVKSL